MLLWLARRAWNLFWDPQGDCLGRRGAFLSCDFGLPRTGSSSAVHSRSLDSLHSSSDTSSSSAWALGLKWNAPKPLEPSGPTYINGFLGRVRGGKCPPSASALAARPVVETSWCKIMVRSTILQFLGIKC